MEVKNPWYELDQGHPTLAMEIEGKKALVHREMKPGMVRHGVVFLGPNFSNADFDAEIQGERWTGCTNDRDVFRLAVAFGLEVYYGRFKVGPAREQPDPEEVKALGDRLEQYALPGAPPWQELTDF
jgi:hypothetical protein